MKKKSKTNIIILIALVILFILSCLIINYNLTFNEGNGVNYSKYYDNANLDNESLKLSKISGKIRIIKNSGWIDFRNDGKCSGSGTYSDPYVIEDLVIDGGGSGICIWIENSNVYFKIENCILYNSGEGIYFSNVNNSQLINNNGSSNLLGIDLVYSNNNEISGNTVNNNAYGIRLWDSNNNEISGNTVNNNGNIGIDLDYNNNNKISGNTVNNNAYGIRLWDNNNTEISGNTANNNNWGGIYLINSNNNTISENTINDSFSGIVLDNCISNIIYLNCFDNTINAVDDGLDNHWDNGYKGNYWADYTGIDADGNGIGDIPYDIAGPAGSQDNFPLMKCPLIPIKIGEIPFELIILISSISGGAVIGIATLLLIRRKRRRTK